MPEAYPFRPQKRLCGYQSLGRGAALPGEFYSTSTFCQTLIILVYNDFPKKNRIRSHIRCALYRRHICPFDVAGVAIGMVATSLAAAGAIGHFL